MVTCYPMQDGVLVPVGRVRVHSAFEERRQDARGCVPSDEKQADPVSLEFLPQRVGVAAFDCRRNPSLGGVDGINKSDKSVPTSKSVFARDSAICVSKLSSGIHGTQGLV